MFLDTIKFDSTASICSVILFAFAQKSPTPSETGSRLKCRSAKLPKTRTTEKRVQAREDELYRQIYAASGSSARCVGRRGIESCE